MKLSVYAMSPLLYALVLLVVLAVFWRRWPRRVRYPLAVVELLLVLAMTPLGAYALVRLVELRLPSAQACAAPKPDTIVVLTGGIERPPRTPDDYSAMTLSSLRRLFAGVALWRRTSAARLVISGGGEPVPEAEPLARLAERMGVPAAAIVIEGRSRNTWEEAQYVAALSPAIPKRIWLVTSAPHMPRALGAFRAWGFAPCAWSSGSPLGPPRFGPGALVPQGWSLSIATAALHELFGDVQYAWLAWRHARHLRAAAAAHTP